MSEEPPLNSLRMIVTTSCNAYQLRAAPGTPSACGMCYRQSGEMHVDQDTIDKVFSAVETYGGIGEYIFTGGEPLVSSWIEYLLARAKNGSAYMTVHTNLIALPELAARVMPYIDRVSVPIDGVSDSAIEYARGIGYKPILDRGIELVQQYGKAIGVNTFVTKMGLPELSEIGKWVAALDADYWLISQYRPINLVHERAQVAGAPDYAGLYGVDTQKFKEAVQSATCIVAQRNPRTSVFSLPADITSFPARLWVFADGRVWTDPATGEGNLLIGDLVKGDTLAELVARMYAVKRGETDKVVHLVETHR